jgi:hypothetical protein
MTDLNKLGRYDRMTDDLFKLTGEMPTSMHDFVKLHAAAFTRRETRLQPEGLGRAAQRETA